MNRNKDRMTKMDASVQRQLNQAQQFVNQGKADQAEAVCRQVLSEHPGDPHCLHMLGLIFHNKGEAGQAIACLRRACQSTAAPARYHSNLAEMLRRQGLLAEAETWGRKAIALDSTMTSAWNNLGIVLQEAGKLQESLACLEKVVALEPRNANAHNNLGNTYRRLGNLLKAELHWKRALELNPSYAETYSNLANIFKEQGQYDNAIAFGLRALQLNPKLADAYINLAATENARWRYAAALRWLDRLLSFAPDHVLALAARATTLKELERLDEALASAEQAARLRPDNAEVQYAYGTVLLSLGRFEEAIACFDRALTLPSAIRERILVARALAYQENGQSDVALELLDDILVEFPHSVQALCARSDIVKFKQDDPELRQMLALIGSDEVQSQSDRISLHFALGKAFLDLDDSDNAFKHLNDGNNLKRSIVQYDPERTSQWLASIIDTFSPTVLEKYKCMGATSCMPIFVVGMPRSGTTLIEQILASHPQIHGAGELKYLTRIVEDNGGLPDLLANINPAQLTNMGDAYVAKVSALAGGKPYVIDKMPVNFMYAGLIRLILPNAKIIHARRDPVDTCLSCYSKLFSGEQAFTYDMAELGRFYADYQNLMAHWRAVLPDSHFIEIDYEDVVADIETQARRMLEFIGVPWEPACLDFYQTTRPVRTASVNQVRQPIYTTSAGRWRKHADNLQPLLKALGIHEQPLLD